MPGIPSKTGSPASPRWGRGGGVETIEIRRGGGVRDGLLLAGLTRDGVAVSGERADHHDRLGGEHDVAEGELLDDDARAEGRDRLEAQHLLDGARRELGARG